MRCHAVATHRTQPWPIGTDASSRVNQVTATELVKRSPAQPRLARRVSMQLRIEALINGVAELQRVPFR